MNVVPVMWKSFMKHELGQALDLSNQLWKFVLLFSLSRTETMEKIKAWKQLPFSA